MKSTDILSPKRSLTTLHAIFLGGLIAGTLDAVDGVIAFGTQGLNPIQVLQYITSGALGQALVYIAAMAPDEGETVGQLLHRAAPHASAPALVPDEDGFLWMSAKGFAEDGSRR